MTERVIPREAMTAEPLIDGGWRVEGGPEFTDAEFAAAFRPASDLDELVAAIRWKVEDHTDRYGSHACPLCAALRRWDRDQ